MAQAVEIQSIEEMRAQVRKSMPAYLANPTEVVDQMLNVELAPPLSIFCVLALKTWRLRSVISRRSLPGILSSSSQRTPRLNTTSKIV